MWGPGGGSGIDFEIVTGDFVIVSMKYRFWGYLAIIL